MNKALLVLSREYLTRVRKKSFIIMTFVGPLLFAGITVLPIWLTNEAIEEHNVYVQDESGLFRNHIKSSDKTRFIFIEMSLEEAKESVSGTRPNLLVIPNIDLDNPRGITLFSHKNPSIALVNEIKNILREKVEELKLDRSGIDKSVIDNLRTDLGIETVNLTSGEEKQSNVITATVIGYLGAFMIYFFIFYYGTQIMRGVIEEKTNRIIEVIVSSVKPFQLMLGKVLGIGAVGLTQFALWVVLTMAITTVVGAFMDFDPGIQTTPLNTMVDTQSAELDTGKPEIQSVIEALFAQDYSLVLVAFIFYFLGGFFLYGALFAAVGSAIDHESDAQQFMLPLTIPLIFSIVALSAILNEPNGTLAFWLSVIPFTSPVIMMMRVPFQVPVWELILSMVLLIAGFIFTTWLAGRIYRVGILVYGTKVNYKTLAKWFFVRN